MLKKKGGVNSSFTVRKVSFGEGVERVFQLYSPNLDSIELIRSGKVRRAKLYYLRDRSGKSARINEKIKKKLGVDLTPEVREQDATQDGSKDSANEENKPDLKLKLSENKTQDAKSKQK